MKELLFFMLPGCPHCNLARRLISEVMRDKGYDDITVKEIDERKNAAYAEKFDYYLVPSFYLDGVKLHEGHAERGDIERVLDAAHRAV